jgi:hypothetical protein
MEADAIVEGFLEAESKHGLRYMRLTADGDSFVYARNQEQVPIWGSRVSKIECANHACKCLRSSLERLVSDKPEYKGKGKLTLQTRVRLVKGVRCAIRMRSDQKDQSRAKQQLEQDIRNSVYHVFGMHECCSDFCKAKPSASVSEEQDEDDGDVSSSTAAQSVPTLVDSQYEYWQHATDEDEEKSRYGVQQSGSESVTVSSDILRDVSFLLNRLANKTGRLIGNFTTNLAESWMAIRTKFDGGKMYNRCNRGSWHARCFGGVLRQNFGPEW